MASFGVDVADVSLGEYLPGDTVPASALAEKIKCSFSAPEELTEIRLWGGDRILMSEKLPAGTTAVERIIEIAHYKDAPYFHLELRGKNAHLISNPFFVK